MNFRTTSEPELVETARPLSDPLWSVKVHGRATVTVGNIFVTKKVVKEHTVYIGTDARGFAIFKLGPQYFDKLSAEKLRDFVQKNGVYDDYVHEY